VAVGSSTNSATRMPRGTSRMALTFAPCSNGWDTVISHRPWFISKVSATATYKPESTRAASQHSRNCVWSQARSETMHGGEGRIRLPTLLASADESYTSVTIPFVLDGYKRIRS
jgi:hypothetical protein